MYDAGKEVPAIRDKPSVQGYEWLWEAFADLDTCRDMGVSAGPIPWTAIEQYARANELGVDETWMLHLVIRHIDNIWREGRSKASAMETSQTTKVPHRGTARR